MGSAGAPPKRWWEGGEKRCKTQFLLSRVKEATVEGAQAIILCLCGLFISSIGILGAIFITLKTILFSLKAKDLKKEGPPYQSIVITGASKGIGRSLAEGFAEPGVHLTLVGRNKDLLDEVKEVVCRKGSTASVVVGDVGDREKMESAMLEVDQKNPVDLVIANAGIHGGMLPKEYRDNGSEKVRQVFRTNIDGVNNTILPFVDRMIERKSGHLAVVSSVGGFVMFGSNGIYGATKACNTHFCRYLRNVVEPHGVNVSAICPGFIATDMVGGPNAKMPFLLTVEQCTEFIQQGLLHNKPVICFPFPMYMIIWSLSILPPKVGELLTSKMSPGMWPRYFA